MKVNDNTLLIGSEDGFVRGVGIYPNKDLGILGQHEEDENFPVTRLSVSHCKRFAASLSHDSSIKFYDIAKFTRERENLDDNIMEGSSDDSSDEGAKGAKSGK